MVLVGAVACEGEADRSRPTEVDDIPERTLHEAVRLGGADAPEEVSFQSEPQVAVHPSGQVFVLHAPQGRVAVLAGDGRLVRWIGRRGSGPGEFEFAAGLGFLGDTVWIRNVPSPRIERFLIDGTHVGSARTPFDYGYPMSSPAGVSGYLAGGRAWVQPDGSVAGRERPVQLPVLVGDRAMQEFDTLFTVTNPSGRLAGQAFAPYPRPPFFDAAEDGSGIALAEWSDSDPGQLRVRIFGADGAEVRRWLLHFAPEPVAERMRDSVISAGMESVRQMAERLRRQGIPEGTFRGSVTRAEVEAEVYLPAHHPPVRRVLMGTDGTIWLQRVEGLRPGRWVAFDAGGEPLFQVRVPDGVTVRQAAREWVWGTVRDELDVPWLVRWDVR